ncbi:MAG: hypothetical protein Q8P49_01950 [Candidatus Liptonbacteria bacterium]|nr:hypothetical protein [Candidatus Liptonbacteria bacterium]
MVNPQLVTYCESQMKLGATKDEIKSALIAAGWPAADVEDSLASVQAAPERNAPAQAAPAQKQATISVSDLISNSSLAAAPVKTEISPIGGKGKAGMEFEEKSSVSPKSRASLITQIVLGLVAVICAGGAVYFYMQNRTLQEKNALLSAASDSMGGEVADLNSQIGTLTKERDELKSQVATLSDANAVFLAELAFFAVPPSSASSTGEVAFDFTGTIGGGGKTRYTVTDANGVKINVINSTDAKVIEALKPLLGTSAKVSGTHLLGSNGVTVTGVNGTIIQ